MAQALLLSRDVASEPSYQTKSALTLLSWALYYFLQRLCIVSLRADEQLLVPGLISAILFANLKKNSSYTEN